MYEEGIDDSEGYLYEGLCYCVSPNGKYVTGYWSEDGTSLTGFRYDVETGSLDEFENGGTVVTNNGKVYAVSIGGAFGYVWENGEETSFWETVADLDCNFMTQLAEEVKSDGMMTSCYAATEDGKVLGGSFTYDGGFAQLQYPSIIVMK